MENTFLDKLRRGQQPLGSFSGLCSPASVECMALAGLDYVILDMEHSPATLTDVADGIRAAQARGMTPLVRLGSLTREAVLRSLDLGARGLIAPCVNSVQDVEQLIQYAKYPPLGVRGLAFGRASGWGSESWVTDLPAYFSICNSQQLLIPQCETGGCLAQIDSIVALEGVAGIFIGPYDLSAAMGIPGQFTDPALQSAIRRVMESCHQAGKFCMIYTEAPEDAARYLALGIDSVTLGMDPILYIRMYRQLISSVRALTDAR